MSEYKALRGGDRAGDRATYEAFCYGTEVGSTPNTGTDFIKVHFYCKEHNGVATKTLWLTDKAWKQTEEVLLLLGWERSHGYKFAQLGYGLGSESPLAKIAKPVDIVVEEEADKAGKLWPQVRWVNELGSTGAGGAAGVAMTPDQARAFDDNVARKLGLGAPPAPAPGVPPGRGAPTKAQKPPAGPPGAKPESIPMRSPARPGDPVADVVHNVLDKAKGDNPKPAPGDDDYNFDDLQF